MGPECGVQGITKDIKVKHGHCLTWGEAPSVGTYNSPRQKLVPEGGTFLQAEEDPTWNAMAQPKVSTQAQRAPHPEPLTPQTQGTKPTTEQPWGLSGGTPHPHHHPAPKFANTKTIPSQGTDSLACPTQAFTCQPGWAPPHPQGPQTQQTLQLQLLPRQNPASPCLCGSTQRSEMGQNRQKQGIGQLLQGHFSERDGERGGGGRGRESLDSQLINSWIHQDCRTKEARKESFLGY